MFEPKLCPSEEKMKGKRSKFNLPICNIILRPRKLSHLHDKTINNNKWEFTLCSNNIGWSTTTYSPWTVVFCTPPEIAIVVFIFLTFTCLCFTLGYAKFISWFSEAVTLRRHEGGPKNQVFTLCGLIWNKLLQHWQKRI